MGLKISIVLLILFLSFLYHFVYHLRKGVFLLLCGTFIDQFFLELNRLMSKHNEAHKVFGFFCFTLNQFLLKSHKGELVLLVRHCLFNFIIFDFIVEHAFIKNCVLLGLLSVLWNKFVVKLHFMNLLYWILIFFRNGMNDQTAPCFV